MNMLIAATNKPPTVAHGAISFPSSDQLMQRSLQRVEPLCVHLADAPARTIVESATEPMFDPHDLCSRTGPAAPRAQHHHRVDVRRRPPLPLHDARRTWPAPAAVIRPAPGDWHPRMPKRLDDGSSRTGARAAMRVCRLAALADRRRDRGADAQSEHLLGTDGCPRFIHAEHNMINC